MKRPNHSENDEKKIQSLEKEINSFHEKLINVENQKKKVILDRINALYKIFDNGNNHLINFFLKKYIEKAKEFGVDPSKYSEIEQELSELEKKAN